MVIGLFLHADIVYLARNMLLLYVFGNTLENELRTKKMLTAFFTGDVLAFLLNVFFYVPSDYMIRASVAIFTLTAIGILVKPLKFSFAFLIP